MPRLEMEFGFMPPDKLAGDGRVQSGVLPAGRYATVTYLGHYKDLMDVTATLIGWARETNVEWDSVPGSNGERFACRYELYPNGPMDEPDPAKWETQIYIKVRG
jgi:effector-binding domain-containing protein